MNHEVNIENKKQITISGVSSIDGFDENSIFVNLENEGMIVFGKDLHIEGLDLETGQLVATGQIEALEYAKKKVKKSLRERFLR